jgi:collagenase-like PrtC family protease
MIKLIKKCNDYGIETIIIMNSICEGEKTGDKEHLMNVISYLKKLYKVGLSSVSVTNLLYVPFIKKSIPGITIFSSVNCYVKNAETAIYLKKI